MSNTDSFIEEVSEEVRRDRLYKLFRKWGWVPVLLVVAIVGGAAYFEWQRSQAEAQAQAFGDALLEALDGEDPAGRIAALEGITSPNAEATMIIALLAAAEEASADQPAQAAARLREAAEIPDLDRRYVDLALLKAQMMDPAPEDEARLILGALAEPGAPYAPLAQEQLALVEVRAGNLDEGLDLLRAIERSAAATAGLQQRAGQLIVSLESGAVLLDEAPAELAPVDAIVPLNLGDGDGAEEEAVEGEAADVTDPAPEAETEAEVGADAEGEEADPAAVEDEGVPAAEDETPAEEPEDEAPATE